MGIAKDFNKKIEVNIWVDKDLDVDEFGCSFLRRKFVGDRPARSARSKSQLALQLEIMQNKDFIAGKYDTGFLERMLGDRGGKKKK